MANEYITTSNLTEVLTSTPSNAAVSTNVVEVLNAFPSDIRITDNVVEVLVAIAMPRRRQMILS